RPSGNRAKVRNGFCRHRNARVQPRPSCRPEKMHSHRLYRFCWMPHVGSCFFWTQRTLLTLTFRLKMDAEENSVVRLDRCAEQQAFRHRSARTHRVGVHLATEVGALLAHTKVLTRSARS